MKNSLYNKLVGCHGRHSDGEVVISLYAFTLKYWQTMTVFGCGTTFMKIIFNNFIIPNESYKSVMQHKHSVAYCFFFFFFDYISLNSECLCVMLWNL